MSKLNYDADHVIKVCRESPNMAQAARRLNMHKSTFIRVAKVLGCYRPNPLNKQPSRVLHRKDIQDLYLSNKNQISASILRKLLIREGFKQAKCQLCGLTQWLGNPIPLDLHHINSNHYDNTLNNLQLLCPTCHAVITRASKIKRQPIVAVFKETGKPQDIPSDQDFKYNIVHKKQPINKICAFCNKPFIAQKTKNKFCSVECARSKLKCKAQQLLEKIKELKTYTAVGSFYGVAPNTIKKRCKKLGIYQQVQPIIREQVKLLPKLKHTGTHLSEQTKQKISRARKGRYTGHGRAVARIDMQTGQIIQTYITMTQAQRQGFFTTGIRRVCIGKLKQYKGFLWKYI